MAPLRNVLTHVGTVVDSDIATWTESAKRRFVGIDTPDQAKLMTFIKDVVNSEYGFLWIDREGDIRMLGRKFWRHREDLDDGSLPVISDAMCSKYRLLGIGELNYSTVKIQHKLYEENQQVQPG